MELAKDFTHVPSHQQRTVLFRPGEFRTLATVRETVEALGIDWELLEDPHFLIEPAAFEKWASGRKGWSPIAQRWQAVRQKHSPARGRALRLVHSEPIKVSPNTHPGGCGTICQNARATAPIRGWEVLLMDQAI